MSTGSPIISSPSLSFSHHHPPSAASSPLSPIPRRPSLNSLNSYSGPPSSSSVRIQVPGKSILKKPNNAGKDASLLSRWTTRLTSSLTGAPASSADGTGEKQQAKVLKRAHFILPEIAIVYPISSAMPPSTPTLKEEKRLIEEKEKERRYRVVRRSSSFSSLTSSTVSLTEPSTPSLEVVDEYWPLSKVESFYQECCGIPAEADPIISKALLSTPDTHPRTLTISSLLVPTTGELPPQSVLQTITPLADILSIEWGLRRLTLSYTHLTATSLKPLLHALLIPNSLTYLSLEGNTKLKGDAWKFLAAFLKESKTLRFLDLSKCPSLGVEKKGIEYIVDALPKHGQEEAGGIQSLKLDGIGIPVASLEVLAKGVRTSGLVNISLRYNKINSSGGAVAIALMCRDWPDVVPPSTPSTASSSAPNSVPSSPTIASPVLPPTPTLPPPPKPYLPPPKHPGQTLPTTYTPYVPRSRRGAAPPAASSQEVNGGGFVSSIQGGITARYTPSPLPISSPKLPSSTPSSTTPLPTPTPTTQHTHPSPALLRQVRALDSLPRISSLTTLDLKSNSLSSNGLSYLSQVLKRNRSLKVLNLSDNKIGPEGLGMVGEALKYNCVLETLDLSKNPCCGPLNLEGVMSLRTSFPQNTSLKRLFLSATQFTSQSAISLAEFLPDSPSLLHLTLTDNPLLDLAGVLALGSALKKNGVMRCLDLDVPIGERGVEEEYARVCREILGVCVRNTERAERRRFEPRGGHGGGFGDEPGTPGTPSSATTSEDEHTPGLSARLIGPPSGSMPILVNNLNLKKLHSKSPVWTPLESSALIKGVLRRESVGERARGLLGTLNAILASHSSSNNTTPTASPAPTTTGEAALAFLSPTFSRLVGPQVERKEKKEKKGGKAGKVNEEEVYAKAQSVWDELGRVIQGIMEDANSTNNLSTANSTNGGNGNGNAGTTKDNYAYPVPLEELLSLHDELGDAIRKMEGVLPLTLPLPGNGTKRPNLSVRVPGLASSPAGSEEALVGDEVIAEEDEGEGDADVGEDGEDEEDVEDGDGEGEGTPKIDKGKSRAPPPPLPKHELVLSPTLSHLPPSPPGSPSSSSIDSDSFESAEDVYSYGDGDGGEGEGRGGEGGIGGESPVDRSKSWTTEEGEVFRKGNVLLGPEEMEGEWEGEILRRELLEAQLERPPPREDLALVDGLGPFGGPLGGGSLGGGGGGGGEDSAPNTASSLPPLEVINLPRGSPGSPASAATTPVSPLPYVPRTRSGSSASSIMSLVVESPKIGNGENRLGGVKEET